MPIYGMHVFDGNAPVKTTHRAKQFGGGGHKNAAGFKSDLASIQKFGAP
jgi:nanoRNase/pAp phosphatase (c-di-AMP/oligoRNAs hydrolase)